MAGEVICLQAVSWHLETDNKWRSQRGVERWERQQIPRGFKSAGVGIGESTCGTDPSGGGHPVPRDARRAGATGSTGAARAIGTVSVLGPKSTQQPLQCRCNPPNWQCAPEGIYLYINEDWRQC